MNSTKELGKYSQSFISDIPADLTSEEATSYKQSILKYPEEGIYIYSFKKGRMIYADGWEEVIGWKNDKINLLDIVNSPASKFAPFVHEFNDKALLFLHTKKKYLEEYSFIAELKILHKDGREIPVKASIRVHKADKNGNLISIMGRFQVDRSLRFGNVMKYSVYGSGKRAFEEALNKSLFHQLTISQKEKEALLLVAQGFCFKEIAAEFDVSQSAIEKRILPLYKRFNLKSLSHLVSFAYENNILP